MRQHQTAAAGNGFQRQSDKVKAGRAVRRVLIVDDNQGLRRLLVTFFSGLQYDVSEAADGKEAFELFRQQPFDLVVTDVQMPKWNGLRLLSSIKAISRETPVVLMTGMAITEIAPPAAAAVLHKPFRLEDLQKTVSMTFGSGRQSNVRRAEPVFS